MNRRKHIEELPGGSLVVYFPDDNACVFIDWKGPCRPKRLTATVVPDLEALYLKLADAEENRCLQQISENPCAQS